MRSVGLSFIFFVIAALTTYSNAELLMSAQTPTLVVDRLKSISGKQLDAQKVLLVSLLGFDAEDSAGSWKTLIAEGVKQHSNDDTPVSFGNPHQSFVEISEISGDTTVNEALSYGGGDIVVLYAAGNIPNTAWQGHLQALVDANQGALSTPMSIVVLVDDLRRKEVEKTVNIVLQNAPFAHKKAEVTYLSPSTRESEETLTTTLQNIVTENLSSRLTLKTLQAHIKSVSAPVAKRSTQQTPRSFHHLRALDVAIFLSESFVRELESGLADYASPDWTMEGSVGEITTELESIIASITAQHAIQHASDFTRFREFDQFTSTVQQQTRLALQGSLGRILRNVAQRVHERVLFSFDQVIMETSKQVLKSEQASDGSEVRAVLKQAREDGLAAAKQIMQQWRSALGRLLNLETDSGVFAAAVTSSASSVKSNKRGGYGHLQLPADYDLDTNDLRNRLRTMSQDAIASLTLDGGINPLLRTLPFPPMHINVNYLLNPASVLADRSFSALYDEHKEGYAAGRADPMTFPGIATFPFDTRDRALSEEEHTQRSALKGPRSWLRGVQEIFSTDDDDVETNAITPKEVAAKKRESKSLSQAGKSGEKEAVSSKTPSKVAGRGWGFRRSSSGSQNDASKESAAKQKADDKKTSSVPAVENKRSTATPASKAQEEIEELEEYEDEGDEEEE